MVPLTPKTAGLDTLEPQDSAPLTMAQLPLPDLSVTPPEAGVPVKVAQVPLVYQVPPEMRQPFCEPLV